MTTVDLFGVYVRNRLEQWGEEFAYHRDRVRAGGYRSKDMLQVLIEHEGEMPPRPTGWKPEEVDLEALQIEEIVREMYQGGQRLSAWALRAYYCGNGRRAVERFHFYRALIGRNCGLRQYYEQIRLGTDQVRAALVKVSRNAA
jgi:hypothetical protein